MGRIDGSPTRNHDERDLCSTDINATMALKIDKPLPIESAGLELENSRCEMNSLIGDSIDGERKISVTFFCFHPEVQKNWRTVLALTMLFLVGGLLIALAFFAISIGEYTQGINYFIGGLLFFIPGAYHICYISLAAKGYPGFEFRKLQVFA